MKIIHRIHINYLFFFQQRTKKMRRHGINDVDRVADDPSGATDCTTHGKQTKNLLFILDSFESISQVM